MNAKPKKYALVPSERNKPCPHNLTHWTGEIPCTGAYHCDMCGASWNSRADYLDGKEPFNQQTRVKQ